MPGTGLGLAIVDALARRWGARAALANRPVGGARAELRFPAVTVPVSAAPDTSTTSPTTARR